MIIKTKRFSFVVLFIVTITEKFLTYFRNDESCETYNSKMNFVVKIQIYLCDASGYCLNIHKC